MSGCEGPSIFLADAILCPALSAQLVRGLNVALHVQVATCT